MAGPEWGEAHIEITADGSLLDRSIARMADAAGRTAAVRLTRAFNTGIRNFGGNFSTQLVRLNEKMSTTDRIVNRLDRSFLKLWKTLPHGFRQFTFYTALFANLGESIAVLGSAAGAGLTVLGATATFAGIGLAALIVAFTGLTGAIEDLPPEIQPAVRSLRNLGDEFADLRRQLQIRTLVGTEKAFDSLRDTVRALTPVVAKLGDNFNSLINDFAKRLKPGTRDFENLSRVIEKSGPIFERLARIVGTFGSALLTAFASPAMEKSVNELLDWLQDLAEGFDRFVQGNGLDTWLGHASAVFGAVGRLLDAVGQSLNNLVDAEAVGRLTGFLDNITGFVPSLENLIDILGELDIFGLIAELLNDFGAALDPLAGPLADLAGAVSDVINSGIDALAPLLEDIATALAPLVQGLADMIAADPDAIAEGLLAFAGAALVLKGAKGLAGLPAKITAVTASLKGLLALVPILGILTLIFQTLAFERDSDWFKAIDEAGDEFFNNTVPGWFEGVMVATAAFLLSIIGAFANGWNQIVTFFTTIVTTIAASWDAFWIGLIAATTTFITGIVTGFTTFGVTVMTIWNTIWTNIISFFTTVITNIIAGITGFGATIAAIWTAIWTNVSAFFVAVWNGIVSFVGGAVNAVSGVITSVIGAIAGWWSGVWAGIQAVAASIWSGIVSFVSGAVNNLRSTIVSVISGISSVWNSVWSAVAGFFSGIWGGIIATARNAVNTVVGIINGIVAAVNRVLGAISSISGGLVNLRLPSLPGMQAGGITTGPTLAGENGMEMVIPLTRPLSMVDPSVRAYAAAIRGQGTLPEGVAPGPQRNITIMPGAVTVHTVIPDAKLVGSAVLDAVVAKLN